ncbi:protein mono-ADP-ribosyltransferase PARP12 isoform X2 [Thalassophryne amazonica]|uniref:protein mono-ADP-ribosyltransferase PARP12 isoform X2 n=1 Tax=Thalassophryne amazonica TaxID=390379 RepID=UPI001470AEE2|nr:protein mono-ADP-ribosyltransferase PARP12 isoform X2 [Thalassophryne amazonica]
MDSAILKKICASKGSLNTCDLLCDLGLSDPTDFFQLISDRDKFVFCFPDGQQLVVARINLRVCRIKDCPRCRGLHVCKNFLYSGSCHYDRRRGGCRFSHQLDSDYNMEILRGHGLENLTRTELCTLLLQSDNALLPSICYDYNNGNGEHGRCKDGNDCKRLHICEKSLQGDCHCHRSHNFNCQQPLKNLHDKAVPDHLISSLKSIYFNKQALRDHDNSANKGNNKVYNKDKKGNNSQKQQQNCSTSDAVTNNGPTTTQEQDPNKKPSDGNLGNKANEGEGNSQELKRTTLTNNIPDTVRNAEVNGKDGLDTKAKEKPQRNLGSAKDKTEICLFFVKGTCKYEERCYKAHYKLPYRWELQEGDHWTALPNNESIEKDYCNPENTYGVGRPAVSFDTMTCGANKVRRLSTPSYVLEPNFILTTQWVWYWEDESGVWNQYAATTSGHKASDIDSVALEQKFVNNDSDEVEFKAGSQTYSLSFKDMIQVNKQYGTKKVVRRRPRFVSTEDIQAKRVRRPLGQPSNFTTIPAHWDKSHIPQIGYERVPLQHLSAEYTEIESLFCKTMKGYEITKIERIQNKALWEIFQWQNSQMKKYNGGRNVTEKKLFHGTNFKYVDAICHNNFDWRICGLNGTAFGRGSYFARDARYSHNYTGDSSARPMFISRVLVGSYTKGSSSYTRPPSKDGGDTNFYDSCVDDVHDPSIFVVFEKHQIYPEYLLQYKDQSFGNPYVSAATSSASQPSRPVPQPSRPTPLPSRPVYPASIPNYQPSLRFTPFSQSSTYQRSYSSQPSPKKEANSCVIA